MSLAGDVRAACRALQRDRPVADRRRALHDLRQRLDQPGGSALAAVLDNATLADRDGTAVAGPDTVTWSRVAELGVALLMDEFPASAGGQTAAGNASGAPAKTSAGMKRTGLVVWDDVDSVLKHADSRHSSQHMLLEFIHKSIVRQLVLAIAKHPAADSAARLLQLFCRRILSVPAYAQLVPPDDVLRLLRASIRHLQSSSSSASDAADAGVTIDNLFSPGARDFAHLIRWTCADAPPLVRERLFHTTEAQRLEVFLHAAIAELARLLGHTASSAATPGTASFRPLRREHVHVIDNDDEDTMLGDDAARHRTPTRSKTDAAAAACRRRRSATLVDRDDRHTRNGDNDDEDDEDEDDGGFVEAGRQQQRASATNSPAPTYQPWGSNVPPRGNVPAVEIQEALLQALTAYWRFLLTAAPRRLLEVGQELHAALAYLVRVSGNAVGYAAARVLRLWARGREQHSRQGVMPLLPPLPFALADALRSLVERTMTSNKDGLLSLDNLTALDLIVDVLHEHSLALASGEHEPHNTNNDASSRPRDGYAAWARPGESLNDIVGRCAATPQYSARCAWLLPLVRLALLRHGWRPALVGDPLQLLSHILVALRDPAVKMPAVGCLEALAACVDTTAGEWAGSSAWLAQWRQAVILIPLREARAEPVLRRTCYSAFMRAGRVLQAALPLTAAVDALLHQRSRLASLDLEFMLWLVCQPAYANNATVTGSELLAWTWTTLMSAGEDQGACCATAACLMAQAVTAASVPLPLAFPLTSVADLLRDAASAQAELSLAAAVKLLQFDEMAQAEATTSATATLLATHFVHIFGSSGEPIRAISTDTLRRIIVGWLEKDNRSESSPRSANHFFRLSALAVRVSTIMKWLLLLPQLADVPLALPDDELALSVPEASNVLEFVVRGLRLLAASLAAVPPTESVCPEAPRALGVVTSLFSMGSASVSAWRVNLPQRRDLHYRDGTANTEVDTNARMLVRWCAKHVDGCAALAVVAENSQRLFSACLPLTEVGGAAPQPGASMDMDADFDTDMALRSDGPAKSPMPFHGSNGDTSTATATAAAHTAGFAPRHLTEEVQARLLDIVHAARSLQATLSQVVVTTPLPTFIRDEELLANVLMDAQAPLYIVLSTAHSLTSVPATSAELRLATARHMLTLISDETFDGCLVRDPSFHSDPHFGIVLRLLTATSPLLLLLGTTGEDKKLRECAAKALADLIQQYYEKAGNGSAPPPGYGLPPQRRMALADCLMMLLWHSPEVDWCGWNLEASRDIVTNTWAQTCLLLTCFTRDADLECRLAATLALPRLLQRLSTLASRQKMMLLFAHLENVHRELLTPFDAHDNEAESLSLKALARSPKERFAQEYIQHVGTSLLLLSRLATVVLEAQNWIMFLLLREARGPLTHVVEACVRAVAKAKGYSSVFDMTAALLPYLCCRWLEQAVLYNVNHSDVALRTPFHALPFWLLDERCGAAMTATRHLFIQSASSAESVQQAYPLTVRQAAADFYLKNREILICAAMIYAPEATAAGILPALAHLMRRDISTLLTELAPAIHAFILTTSSTRRRFIKEQLLPTLLGVGGAVERFWIDPRKNQLHAVAHHLLLMATPSQPRVWSREHTARLLNKGPAAAGSLSSTAADTCTSTPHWQLAESTLPTISANDALRRLNSEVANMARGTQTSMAQFLPRHQSTVFALLHDLSLLLDRQAQVTQAQLVFALLDFVVHHVVNVDRGLFSVAAGSARGGDPQYRYAPNTQRLAVTCALRALHRWGTALLAPVCDYLLRLFQSVADQHSVMCPLQPTVALTVTDLLLDCSASGTASSSSVPVPPEAVQLLHLLHNRYMPEKAADGTVSETPQRLAAVLDPLPAHITKLSALRQQQQQLRQGWPVASELWTWIWLGQQVPSAPRRAGLVELANKLEQLDDAGELQQLPVEHAVMLVAELQRLVKADQCSSVQPAARCLGVLAGLDPLRSIATLQASSLLSSLASREDRLDPRRPDDALKSMLLMVVRAIDAKELPVASAAGAVARTLSQLQELYTLVQSCTELTPLCHVQTPPLLLQTPAPKHDDATTSSLSRRASSAENGDDGSGVCLPRLADLRPDFLSCGKDAYAAIAALATRTGAAVDVNTWLCRLTANLVDQCLDDAESNWADGLQAMLPLLIVSADICQRVWPFVAFALLGTDPLQQNRQRLSRAMEQALAQAQANPARWGRHAQMLLQMMDALRQVRYEPSASRGDVITGHRPQRQLSRSLRGPGHQGAMTNVYDTTGHSMGPSLTHWDNWSWLRVDLLQTAAAAHSCGADYAAVYFLEAWLDMADEASREQHRNRVAALMASAVAAIGEPDAIYAFANPLVPEARIQLYRQEGALVHRLSAWDMLALEESSKCGGGGGDARQLAALNVAQTLHDMHFTTAAHLAIDGLWSRGGMKSELLQRGGNIMVNDVEREDSGGDTALAYERAVQALREVQFEAAWRQRHWDTGSKRGVQLTENGGLGWSAADVGRTMGFHEGLAAALQAMADDGRGGAVDRLTAQLRQQLAGSLCAAPLESTWRVQQPLLRLQMVAELRRTAIAMSDTPTTSLPPSSWTFDTVDNVLAVRRAVLDAASLHVTPEAAQHLQRQQAALEQHFLESARKASHFHEALQSAQRLEERLTALGDADARSKRLLEDAKTLWARKEERLALSMVDRLLASVHPVADTLDDTLDVEQKLLVAKMQLTLGMWRGQLGTAAPTVILSDLLEPALAQLEILEADYGQGAQDVYAAHATVAQFAGDNYQQLHAKLHSQEMQSQIDALRRNEKEEKLLISLGLQETDITVRRRRRVLRARNEQDRMAIKSLKADCNRFLHLTIRSLLHCLQSNHNTEDDFVFRLCAYWFQNTDDTTVNAYMAQAWDAVPSYKFLPLIYQLAARIELLPSLSATSTPSFQQLLQGIVEKAAREHPHHVLFVLLALENGGDKAEPALAREASNGPSAKRSRLQLPEHHAGSPSASSSQNQKAAAVRQLLQRVGCDPALVPLLHQTRTVCEAYMELAMLPITNHRQDLSVFNKKFRLANLRESETNRVAVLTKALEVDLRGRYDKHNVVFIHGFDDRFSTPGGINLPRVLHCHGADGRRYKQLVKGNDDSRQDAVIQQVFGHVNVWLRHDAACRQRQLGMQTYRVVPLSPQIGVLEWCPNTLPLGVWLLHGPDSAHARYNPKGSWSNERCRRQMDAAAKEELSEGKCRYDVLHNMFVDVCRHFPPVMRRFFTEKYPEPSVWYQRRLTYGRSLAVTSMVGYIIGLGDRHPKNILLRTDTAELVHIDLGVTFEQGKLLPTPERVPFRLTRDMIDGLGAASVEGVFRRCSEQTMHVMRRAQLSLLTILEVFLYDPLHAWKLNPEKAARLQELDEAGLDGGGEAGVGDGAAAVGAGGASAFVPVGAAAASAAPALTQRGRGTPTVAGGGAGQADEAGLGSERAEARRVLARLQTKLQGFDEGAQLSVEGQVNLLIQMATSIENLAQMFCGWQAWA